MKKKILLFLTLFVLSVCFNNQVISNQIFLPLTTAAGTTWATNDINLMKNVIGEILPYVALADDFYSAIGEYDEYRLNNSNNSFFYTKEISNDLLAAQFTFNQENETLSLGNTIFAWLEIIESSTL